MLLRLLHLLQHLHLLQLRHLLQLQDTIFSHPVYQHIR